MLKTAARNERWTAHRLGWAGYVTALPLVTELRRDRVRRSITSRVRVPCFPGYLMVQLDLGRDALQPVIKCEGVKHMLCAANNQPIPLRPGVVELLAFRAERDREAYAEPPVAEPLAPVKPRGLPAIEPGTTARITEGALLDHRGICVWSTSERLGLLMRMLGADVEVIVPRRSVAAA